MNCTYIRDLFGFALPTHGKAVSMGGLFLSLY